MLLTETIAGETHSIVMPSAISNARIETLIQAGY